MRQEELHSLVDRLVSEGETEYIEFKVNNSDPKALGERVSAIANGAALNEKLFGYFILGIEDETCKIVGTSVSLIRWKKGNEPIESWLANQLNPRIDVRFFEHNYDTERKLIIIQVPASNGQPVRFTSTAFIRVGPTTRALQDYPEKERKLWQKPSTEYELEIAKQSLTATEVVSLLDIQTFFDELLRIPQPTTQKKIIEKLIDEKLVVRSNGHFNITNLGALLFAKNLQDFGLERKAPRVMKYKGIGKIEIEKNDLGSKGYAVGFRGLIGYVRGLLPSNEVIGKAIRREIEMYPSPAVRELIANAIIHQDLRETGKYLTIEIYDDRIEISNSGIPTVDTLRFIDGYNARNLHLAAAMRRMGICEEIGSGIDRVVSQCEIFQLPAPEFRVMNKQTIAILYAHKELNQMTKEDKIRACYQHCSLMYVMKQKMTNQSLRERFKIKEENSAIVSRIIRDTVKADLIKPEDSESTSRKFKNYLPTWA